ASRKLPACGAKRIIWFLRRYQNHCEMLSHHSLKLRSRAFCPVRFSQLRALEFRFHAFCQHQWLHLGKERNDMVNRGLRDSTITAHHEPVGRVMEARQNRIEEPLSLGAMAKIAFVSRFHFNRTFRQVTGVPPSQFLYALRLERAKHLLVETQQK